MGRVVDQQRGTISLTVPVRELGRPVADYEMHGVFMRDASIAGLPELINAKILALSVHNLCGYAIFAAHAQHNRFTAAWAATLWGDKPYPGEGLDAPGEFVVQALAECYLLSPLNSRNQSLRSSESSPAELVGGGVGE